jgi:CBS domain-containing membrane protein
MYRVADIMTRKIMTLKADDDLALADSILALGRYRHLPVEENGRLLGLITHRDLLRIWADRGAIDGRTVSAGEIMTRDVTTVTPETPVAEAAQLICENKFGCLPVVEKGRLVGIVTEADFVELAAELSVSAEPAQRATMKNGAVRSQP